MGKETIEIEINKNKWVEKFGKNVKPEVFFQNQVYSMEAIMERFLKENPDKIWESEEELIEVFFKTAVIIDKENFKRNERAKHSAKNVGRIIKQSKAKKPLDF